MAEAAIEAARLWPARENAAFERIPSSWYEVEVDVEVGDEVNEYEPRRVMVPVYCHQETGYDSFERAVERLPASVENDAQWILDEFFSGTDEPLPAGADLTHLANYARANGQLPQRIPFAGRERINPEVVARDILARELPPAAQAERITQTCEEFPELIKRLWGSLDTYRAEVLLIVDIIAQGKPYPPPTLDQVPIILDVELQDYSYGQGVRDLRAALEKVLNDPILFPDGLAEPTGGIHWARKVPKSWWAIYRRGDSRITVSPLLDSAQAPEYVLEFVLYHELLHHQNAARDWRGHPHGEDFPEREQRHPESVEAEAWLDSFHDHYAARAGSAERGVSG